MQKIKNMKDIRRIQLIMSIFLSVILMVFSMMPVYAADPGNVVRSGPSVTNDVDSTPPNSAWYDSNGRTFVTGISEANCVIHLDTAPEITTTGAFTTKASNQWYETSSALAAHNANTQGYAVIGFKGPANGITAGRTTSINGGYTKTFKNAVTFSDGTTGDFVVERSNFKITPLNGAATSEFYGVDNVVAKCAYDGQLVIADTAQNSRCFHTSTTTVRIMKNGQEVTDAEFYAGFIDIDAWGYASLSDPSTSFDENAKGLETIKIKSDDNIVVEKRYIPTSNYLTIKNNGNDWYPTKVSSQSWNAGFITKVKSGFTWDGQIKTNASNSASFSSDIPLIFNIKATTSGDYPDGGYITTDALTPVLSTDNTAQTHTSYMDIAGGKTAVYTIHVKEGYTLGPVTVDGNAATPTKVDDNTYTVTFSKIDANHTIDAQFYPPHTITAEAENGTASPATQTVKHGGTATVTYTPNEGYQLKSVTVDGQNVDTQANKDKYVFSNVDTNHHVKVVYEKIPYEITTSIVNGTITPKINTEYGNNETVTYSPNEGCRIVSIKVDGQDVAINDYPDHVDFNSIKANHDVKVVCEPIPDLSIEKKADKKNYHKGDIVHYTITVKNTVEGSHADNVIVTDKELSKGTKIKSEVTTSKGTVTMDDNGFTVKVDKLLGGETITISFDAEIINAEIASKVLKNTASVDSDDTDPKTGDAESEIGYDVKYKWEGKYPTGKKVPADAKDIPWGTEYNVNDDYKTGDTVKETVDGQKGTWRFNGWDKTGTLTIKDDVEITGTWTFVPEYDIATEVENGTITETETDIPQGQNRTIIYSPSEGYQLKTLTVDGENKDISEYPASYPFNDIKADHKVKAVFEKIPMLEVTKEADKEIYNAGDTVKYTVTVRQTVDGAEARDISIKDVLPNGVTFNKGSIEGDVEVVSENDNGYELKIASLTGAVTFTYTAVTTKGADAEELINVVEATGSNVPGDPAKDDAKVKALTPKPVITKVVSNENPVYGEEVTYTISVKEPQEGIVLRNAVISDLIPEGIEIDMNSVEIAGDPGELKAKSAAVMDEEEGSSETQSNFIVEIPELADETVVTFKAKVTAVKGEVNNVATLTGDDIEPIEANALLTVKEPEPKLTKSVSKEKAYFGDTVTYTLTASSEIALKDAVITDTPPEGIEIIAESVKCSDETAKISVEKNVVRVEFGSLNKQVDITYDARVIKVGKLTNVAELTAFNFPKGPLKAEATIEGLEPIPVIEKSVDKKEVKKGDTLNYTITAYTKEGVLLDAVITDKLPSGIDVNKSDITCSAKDAEVSLKNGTITVKLKELTKEKVTISYKATAKEKGEQKNVATIAGSNYTGDPVEATATVNVKVDPAPTPTPKPVVKSKSPQTGDTPMGMMLIIFGVAAAIAAGTYIYRKRFGANK